MKTAKMIVSVSWLAVALVTPAAYASSEAPISGNIGTDSGPFIPVRFTNGVVFVVHNDTHVLTGGLSGLFFELARLRRST